MDINIELHETHAKFLKEILEHDLEGNTSKYFQIVARDIINQIEEQSQQEENDQPLQYEDERNQFNYQAIL